MSAPRLGLASEALWAPHVQSRPSYRRDGTPGVVHLGLGAFHRAHQAMVFDRLLASGDVDEIWRLARDAGVISAQDHALVTRRNALRDKVIRVDDFPYDLGLKAAVQAMPERSPAQQEAA